jgi:ankyrin repeat protein
MTTWDSTFDPFWSTTSGAPNTTSGALGRKRIKQWQVNLGSWKIPFTVVAIMMYLAFNITMLAILFAFCRGRLRLQDLKNAAKDLQMEHVRAQLELAKEQINLTAKSGDDEENELLERMQTMAPAGEMDLGDESDDSSSADYRQMVAMGGLQSGGGGGMSPMAGIESPTAAAAFGDVAVEYGTLTIPTSQSTRSFVSDVSDVGTVASVQVYSQSKPDDESEWETQTVHSVELVEVGGERPGSPTDKKYEKTYDDDESVVATCNYYMHRSTLIMPVFLHFWDMATDIGVVCAWLPYMNLKDPTAKWKDEESEQLNTLWYVVVSVMAMFFYRLVSGVMYARKYSSIGGIFQFFDLMLFVEVYVSLLGKRTSSTLQLRWIRRMEAIVEAAPQSFLQLIYLLQTGSTGNILIRISLAMAVLSIGNSLVKADEWNFDPATGANQKIPPHPAFLSRLLFRVTEVFGRLICMAFMTQLLGYGATMGLFLGEFVFYFIMQRGSFLGRDIGNIFEVLIAHPNLSLRLDDEHSHSEPFFGCLLRTVMCWTPIAFSYNMLNRAKDNFCGNNSMPDPDTLRQFTTDDDHQETEAQGCWQFRQCMNRNVVTVHYTHRFLESVVELLLVALFYNFKKLNQNVAESQENEASPQLKSFRRSLFLAACVAVISTPILYLIVRRWLITRGAGGIEMNIFGFMKQAHVSGDYGLLLEFLTRVPRSINQQKKGTESTPLLECLEFDNFDLFRRMINASRKVELNLGDADGVTPLIKAARKGLNNELALLLIIRKDAAQKHRDAIRDETEQRTEKQRDYEAKHIINIEAKYAYGKTALITACEYGHLTCVELLLEHGANLNHQDDLGRTPLHYVIHGESHFRNSKIDDDRMSAEDMQTKKEESLRRATVYYEIFTLLLQRAPKLELFDSKRRWTPLFEAVAGGNVKMVARLAHMGANLDAVDVKGQSILHVAVRCNSPLVLQYLLTASERRWNHAHQNRDGDTPLRLAVHEGLIACFKLLAPFEQPVAMKKALLLCAKRNRPHIMAFLLRDLRIDPNFKDKEKMTPLRWAAYNGFRDCVKHLLVGGAKDELDDYGQNIVFYAAKKDQIPVLELLAEANAHFGIVNVDGETALEKATKSDTKKFIKDVRKKVKKAQKK